ncbi:MAG: MBL fold metallo-hydrolase [Roseivirga sp.]|nr:MBL fold metallo-hydrolase [Roseivirga sp.]
MRVVLKHYRKVLLILSLIGLITHHSKAQVEPDFVVTPIAKNIYSIVSPSFGLPNPENKGWNSNSHFIVTEEGVLLFDTGSSESIGHRIKKAITTITDQPVRWVVNSHSHADHWLGNAAFTDTVIEIITSNQALTTMKQDGQPSLEFYSRVTKGTIGTTQLVYPTHLLDQNKKRNFGGVAIEFIFSNDGHSPGDLLMWLPQQKIIFGGDVLSSDWMPVITGHGNVPNLINTLNHIAELKPAIVLTGHGSATTARSVKRDADLLSSVWNQVKEDYADNKDSDETLLNVKTRLEPIYGSLYKDFAAEIERHVKLMYKLQQ